MSDSNPAEDPVTHAGLGVIGATGPVGPAGTCEGGGGGAGGAGGFHQISFTRDLVGLGTVGPGPCPIDGVGHTYSDTSSSGSLQFLDPVPDLQKEVDGLKEKVEELEKAENSRKDIEYFQRNMKKALKIPESVKLGWEMPKVDVGPDDILVVYLNVENVPSDRVEAFMKKAKQGLGSIFEERGLKGRNLWIASRKRETGFAVIGIDRLGLNQRWTPPNPDEDINIPRRETLLTSEDVASARAILHKRKYPPPVMG